MMNGAGSKGEHSRESILMHLRSPDCFSHVHHWIKNTEMERNQYL